MQHTAQLGRRRLHGASSLVWHDMHHQLEKMTQQASGTSALHTVWLYSHGQRTVTARHCCCILCEANPSCRHSSDCHAVSRTRLLGCLAAISSATLLAQSRTTRPQTAPPLQPTAHARPVTQQQQTLPVLCPTPSFSPSAGMLDQSKSGTTRCQHCTIVIISSRGRAAGGCNGSELAILIPPLVPRGRGGV